jgi:hypothetical protein
MQLMVNTCRVPFERALLWINFTFITGSENVNPYAATWSQPPASLTVASRDEALKWAAKFSFTCRSAQAVREIMADPDV